MPHPPAPPRPRPPGPDLAPCPGPRPSPRRRRRRRLRRPLGARPARTRTAEPAGRLRAGAGPPRPAFFLLPARASALGRRPRPARRGCGAPAGPAPPAAARSERLSPDRTGRRPPARLLFPARRRALVGARVWVAARPGAAAGRSARLWAGGAGPAPAPPAPPPRVPRAPARARSPWRVPVSWPDLTGVSRDRDSAN